jgi:hypothetical protein
MAQRSEEQIAKRAAQAQDRETPDVDASAVLSDHMYKFVYAPDPHDTEADRYLSNQSAVSDRNAGTFANLEHQSESVKEALKNHAYFSAEKSQVRVVAMTKELDLGGISAAIAASAAKPGNEAMTALLKIAGAAPLVERVRLGAIQMEGSRETDAEVTFGEAYRAEIAKGSIDLPEVAQLKIAARKMADELKLRRTLPEVFDSNLTLIDTVVKDGALTRDELLNSKKKQGNSSMTQTLIEYLLKNFDQMKHGDNSIDHRDVVAYQPKVMLKGMPR